MYDIKRIASLKTVADFRAYLAERKIDLLCDDEIIVGDHSPLLKPITVGEKTLGNRIAVHPMEGWDATRSGGSTESMRRRWRRFGESGGKLIWGGEAMAVQASGRANPNQLIINEENLSDLAGLCETLLAAHGKRYGNTADLSLGFQLTHSGRFCRPHDKNKLEPRIAYHHPVLDRKFGIDSSDVVFRDDELKTLVDDYVRAAVLAQKAGADFVDIKHCHGYLLHEFLGAHTRPGIYGGSFENRTRLIREIVEGIRAEAPGLEIGVRLSAFDIIPFRPDPAKSDGKKLGLGIPEEWHEGGSYDYQFTVDNADPTTFKLDEAEQFLSLLESLGIKLVNLSAGSPYYNPHIQRPALFPPSDGYQPPEDPLVGVARQINAVKSLKKKFPELLLVGSAYSYLQEYLPHVAQYYLAHHHVDMVGIGRVVLSYPEMLIDAATKGTLNKKLICRTFSDCTTAPRNGLPSGCYPLDDHYKKMPEMVTLRQIKKGE